MYIGSVAMIVFFPKQMVQIHQVSQIGVAVEVRHHIRKEQNDCRCKACNNVSMTKSIPSTCIAA